MANLGLAYVNIHVKFGRRMLGVDLSFYGKGLIHLCFVCISCALCPLKFYSGWVNVCCCHHWM